MLPTSPTDSAATPPLRRPAWTLRQRIVAGAFVAYLVMQLAVPVRMLFEPRPARFGWQMYSGVREWPRFSVVLQDTTVRVDVSRFIVRSRGDYVPADLSAHLCARVVGATAVLELRGAADVREVPCR